MHPNDPNFPEYVPVAVADDDTQDGDECSCAWCDAAFCASVDGQEYCSKACEDQAHEEWSADV